MKSLSLLLALSAVLTSGAAAARKFPQQDGQGRQLHGLTGEAGLAFGDQALADASATLATYGVSPPPPPPPTPTKVVGRKLRQTTVAQVQDALEAIGAALSAGAGAAPAPAISATARLDASETSIVTPADPSLASGNAAVQAAANTIAAIGAGAVPPASQTLGTPTVQGAATSLGNAIAPALALNNSPLQSGGQAVQQQGQALSAAAAPPIASSTVNLRSAEKTVSPGEAGLEYGEAALEGAGNTLAGAVPPGSEVTGDAALASGQQALDNAAAAISSAVPPDAAGVGEAGLASGEAALNRASSALNGPAQAPGAAADQRTTFAPVQLFG